MSESVAQVRNRLRVPRPRALAPLVVSAPDEFVDHSFVVENHESGRIAITSPIETASVYRAADFYLDIRGRLVEAERANSNGAFWTQSDLEFGLPSVAYGPLNWGHDASAIVGTLLDPVLVRGEKAAAQGARPHIQTGARFWSYLAPQRAQSLVKYTEQGKAFFSMECISNEVQCVGPNGCGAVMSYMDAQTKSGAACQHIKDRASFRRFVNPIFQAAAVIVPPQQPGWADASITDIVHEAEAEAASLQVDGLTDTEAVAMVTAILQWSGKRA